ncbi:MAG: glycosyltransferase [Sulfuricella denitrificans]|nr:glycosyltransferase [Sulfuricella denitrificans]
MIRLAFVITGLQVGGAELVLASLLSRLDRSKFDPLVISLTESGPIGAEISRGGTRVLALGMRRDLISVVSGMRRLVGLLRKEKPQILLTWLYHADLAGLVASRIAGVPRIGWNLHCSRPMAAELRFSTRLLARLLAKLSPLPDFVVTVSKASRIEHEKIGYHPRKWLLIPNGIDTALFQPDAEARQALRANLGIPAAAPVVGLFARYNPIKDHATFLDAARIAHESRPDLHFLLAGQGVDDPGLACLIGKRGLKECVHILGERRDMPRLTAALDIAVSASRSEAFSLAIGEAMACGVPCTVTDVDELPILVAGAGMAVPPGQPDAMAAAWLEILAMPDEARQAMGLLGREKIIADYSLTSMAARYEALFTENAPDSTAADGR